MSKQQAKHAPPKGNTNTPIKGVGSSSVPGLKSPPVNLYASAFSPRKPVKYSGGVGNKIVHMYFICSVRGGIFEVAFLEHGRVALDEGFHPHTKSLIRGGGAFEAKNLVVHSDDRLTDMGFVSVHFRRGQDGDARRNVTMSNGDRWKQHVLLRCNTTEEIIKGRTDDDMSNTLHMVCQVTSEWNKKLGNNSRVANEYSYAKPLHEKNPIDGESVSLDHYLLDHEVLDVMVTYCPILSPTFAGDHPDIAAVYFTPNRASYPEGSYKFGFVDGGFAHGDV